MPVCRGRCISCRIIEWIIENHLRSIHTIYFIQYYIIVKAFNTEHTFSRVKSVFRIQIHTLITRLQREDGYFKLIFFFAHMKVFFFFYFFFFFLGGFCLTLLLHVWQHLNTPCISEHTINDSFDALFSKYFMT